MDNELYLNGLYGTYIKVNREKRYDVYYNKYNNNTIVFDPIDKCCNTESIANGIGGKRYMYLMDILNENEGLVVHWSQVEGTTSDYDIYYNVDLGEYERKSHSRIVNILYKSFKASISGMKYNEIINGERIPITF
ncbi:hypothetical protein [Priestia megaterium]|uniref:hypothetical protein n=1 Tax=Priestia megaterium TaxID=1404 RepID=UPI00287811BC|nr:hypothetical protein [Priestia megaterium]